MSEMGIRAAGREERGGGGRNRTHRTGIARPTRVEDEGGHQTPFTSGTDATGHGHEQPFGNIAVARAVGDESQTRVSDGVGAPVQSGYQPAEEVIVKKLLLLLVLVALGAAVARKVRAA
jgi:hypothetical protein